MQKTSISVLKNLISKLSETEFYNDDLRTSLSKVAKYSLFKLHLQWVVIGIGYGLYFVFAQEINDPAPRFFQGVNESLGVKNVFLFIFVFVVGPELSVRSSSLKKTNWLYTQIIDFVVLVAAKRPIGATGFLLGLAVITYCTKEFDSIAVQIYEVYVFYTLIILTVYSSVVYSLSKDTSWYRIFNIQTIVIFLITILSYSLAPMLVHSAISLMILLISLHYFLNNRRKGLGVT